MRLSFEDLIGHTIQVYSIGKQIHTRVSAIDKDPRAQLDLNKTNELQFNYFPAIFKYSSMRYIQKTKMKNQKHSYKETFK